MGKRGERNNGLELPKAETSSDLIESKTRPAFEIERSHQCDRRDSMDKARVTTRDMSAERADNLCDVSDPSKAKIEKQVKDLLRSEKDKTKIAEILSGVGGGIDQMDLAKLSTDTLIKLEDKFPGILLYAFTDIIGKTEKVDFTKWEFYNKPVAGQKLRVDFRGNDAANKEIGAADMLPPSVRRITVYEDGDFRRPRTSEKRVGLKGRNQQNVGFYDQHGYMPVFSGDVIIVGGNVDKKAGIDPKKYIDLDFEKKYSKSPKQAEEESKYLQDLFKKSIDRKGKQMTPEELAALEARVEGSSMGDKIAKTAVEVAKDPSNMGLRGKHCWDWVNKIYRRAGITAKSPVVTIYQNLNYPGKDCGSCHASEEMYARVCPGDWLYYNNRNTADRHGNHSAIFIEWVDKGKKIARMASGSYGKKWRIHTADLADKPITRIAKPRVS